jgi:four helix bundle suffix protein
VTGEDEGFIPPHGGYEELLSYRKTVIIYDATVCFCERFLDKWDRTVDQMVQAARSGKQNIAEGSMASGTSSGTELKLTGVARASLEELLKDYQDFLRVRDLELWDKDSRPAKAVRRLAYKEDVSYETYRTYIEERSPGTVANIIICIIHQANYLLDQQLRTLEREFRQKGGIRERMLHARLKTRDRQERENREQHTSHTSHKSHPHGAPTLTQVLTDIALTPATEDISPQAYRSAKKLLLDALGCALAGRSAPGVREAIDQMTDWAGTPEATIIGSARQVPAPNAAFANAAMIHALDYDDVYIPGTLHITSVIVPTMLAAQEMAGAGGPDALAAMIMGIEAAGRLSMAERGRRRGQGFLPTSLAGGFGAVVTAARLLDLTPDQCVNGMGINYAQTSGNRQALHDSTLTKRMQPAFAARSALWAVALARRGITGPEHALDGESGYFRVYMNGEVPQADELTQERDRLQVERVAVKRWPSCGACHNIQAAAERLVGEEDLEPEQIERVELFGAAPLVSGPFEPGDNPQVSAQFSVEWAVAHTLLRGPASLPDYTDQTVRKDEEVAEFANELEYVDRPEDLPDEPEVPLDYPDRTVAYQGLIVHTRDNRRLMRAQCPAQTFAPGNATFDEVAEKFRECARFSGACPSGRAEEIIEAVRMFDHASGPDGILDLLNAES